MLYGPHGAPDFFTDDDIATLFAASWKVHYNSDRTGVRLIGPRPTWARRDGGEAGLHPSNLHDNAYAIGAMDFTGDMPILLGPDGPSLGGFVCPAVIAQAELWKMGQLRAGDTVRFRRITNAQATRMERELDAAIATLDGALAAARQDERPIRRCCCAAASTRASRRRRPLPAGRVWTATSSTSTCASASTRSSSCCATQRLRGIVDVTPGIRSLQIHYDSRVLPREELMAALDDCERALPTSTTSPSRPASCTCRCRGKTRRRCSRSRSTCSRCAPTRRGARATSSSSAASTASTRSRTSGEIVFDASYLVLGLGDVYLGAPVATPVDPRHRLVTTKYNPARTWTAENSVGIGGAYLCVYGMEGPGGYQFVGRTVQMWNTHRTTAAFEPGTPWLLRFFDQIRFFPVSAAELLEMRDAFPHGKYDVAIEPPTFSLRDYRAFLASIAPRRAPPSSGSRRRSRPSASAGRPPDSPSSSSRRTICRRRRTVDVPEGCEAVRSPMTASVWQVAVEPGQRVEAGQRILVLEAMKMEVEIAAHTEGVVELRALREGRDGDGRAEPGDACASMR